MITEIAIVVLLPMVLVVVARRYAARNPNREKAAIFTGGEFWDRDVKGHGYRGLVKYLVSFFAVCLYAAAVFLSSFDKLWATVWLGVVMLGLMLI